MLSVRLDGNWYDLLCIPCIFSIQCKYMWVYTLFLHSVLCACTLVNLFCEVAMSKPGNTHLWYQVLYNTFFSSSLFAGIIRKCNMRVRSVVDSYQCITVTYKWERLAVWMNNAHILSLSSRTWRYIYLFLCRGDRGLLKRGVCANIEFFY